jgi:aspartate ammonia-lyase
MPGKVNPVIPECMNMICFHVIGNDACIAAAAGAGQLELNVMMPIISFNILQSVEIMTNGAAMLRTRCVEGIQADSDRCEQFMASSVGLATVLNPVIGYQKAAEVAKASASSGKSIRDIVLEKGILSEKEIDELLAKAITPPS